MGPEIIAALATLAGGALQGAGSAFGGGAQAKAAKKTAKEKKRETLADMYNQALKRQLDLYKFQQESSNNAQARKAAALQEGANAFIRALTGR